MNKQHLLRTMAPLAFMLLLAIGASAQPNPGNNQGGGPVGGPPIGGSAPIGGGIVLLITFGAAFGAKKIFDARKKLIE